MKSKKIYFSTIVAFIIMAGVIFWGFGKAPKLEAPIAEKLDGTEEFGIIYYYGRECSHCLNVQSFLNENKIAEKVMFTKKEVWYNAENAQEMNLRAQECGLDKNEVGVPFLYSDGKCIIGEIEVQGFFKKAAGIN